MKVIMHNAISADGFIAKSDGDTSWVSEFDLNLFKKRCLENGCVILGRKTFDEVGVTSGITNIVLTTKPLNSSSTIVFSADSPLSAIALAKSKGCKSVILAGGGETNGSFLKKGFIDEAFLTVHPLILGQGIKLF